MTEKCIARVPGEGRRGSFHLHQCTKNARPGTKYCKVHDPTERAAKNLAADRAYKAERDKQQELRDLFPASAGVWVSALKSGRFLVRFVLSEDETRHLARRLSA